MSRLDTSSPGYYMIYFFLSSNISLQLPWSGVCQHLTLGCWRISCHIYFNIYFTLSSQVRGNPEGGVRLHQEGWLQPGDRGLRAHLRVARRQHDRGLHQHELVQGDLPTSLLDSWNCCDVTHLTPLVQAIDATYNLPTLSEPPNLLFIPTYSLPCPA